MMASGKSIRSLVIDCFAILHASAPENSFHRKHAKSTNRNDELDAITKFLEVNGLVSVQQQPQVRQRRVARLIVICLINRLLIIAWKEAFPSEREGGTKKGLNGMTASG